MKICEQCGAQQNDSRIFCVDCGEQLGDKVSDERENAVQKQNQSKMEKLYNRTDPLYVSKLDKVIGLIAIAFGVTVIVLTITWRRVFSLPEASIYVCLFCAISAVNALIPQILWSLEKLRLSFWVEGSDELTPSSLYWVSRKILIYGCFAVAILFVVLQIYYFFNPIENTGITIINGVKVISSM